MGPSPSADLVGTILGVQDDFKQPTSSRGTHRKAAAAAAVRPAAQVTSSSSSSESGDAPLQIVWRNVLIFIYLHAAALYGFYLCFTAAKWATLSWCKLFLSRSILANLLCNFWFLLQHSSCSCLEDLVLLVVLTDSGPTAATKQNGRSDFWPP